MRALRTYSRDVRFILLVSAIMGFAIDGGVYTVIFNLYMLRMGFGPEFIGQVNSAGLLVFAIASLPVGALGGRFGSKPLMVAGISLCLAGSLALPFADVAPESWQAAWLLVSYVILHLGISCYYVNCSPVLVGATHHSERTRVIAIQSAMIGIFAFGGGMIAGFLPGLLISLFGWSSVAPTPYSAPLLIAGLMLIPAVILISRVSPVTQRSEEYIGSEKGAPSAGISFVGIVVAMSVIRFLQVAGVGSIVTFFNVYMDEALNTPTSLIGMLSAVSRLLAVPAALSVPFITRHVGNAATAIWVSILVVLFMAPLAFVPTWPAAGVSYIAVMACTSIRYPAFFVYLMEITPPQLRATMSGAGEMSAGFSFALIALLGGYIIAGPGFTTLFVMSALMTLTGTLLLWGFLRWSRTKRGRSIVNSHY